MHTHDIHVHAHTPACNYTCTHSELTNYNIRYQLNILYCFISLQLHLIPLCKDKHGSRVVDAVWRNCEVSKKEILAQELLSHENELSDDFYGQIVLRNCNIAHYRRKQAVYQEREKATEKTWEIFRDILDEPVEQLKVATGKGKSKRRREDGAGGDEDSREFGVKNSVPLLHDTKKKKVLYDGK